jgi:hypothetical protein
MYYLKYPYPYSQITCHAKNWHPNLKFTKMLSENRMKDHPKQMIFHPAKAYDRPWNIDAAREKEFFDNPSAQNSLAHNLLFFIVCPLYSESQL